MARGKFDIGQMIMVATFAILGIYLFSQFTDIKYLCTQDDIDDEKYGCTTVGQPVEHRHFKIPADLDTPTLTMIKFIVIGLALTLAYGIVIKTSGGSMSRRDIASLVIIGVVIYLLYSYVLEPMLGWTSFSDISWTTAMKLGLI